MDETRALLRRTADHAADFLDTLDERPVFPSVTVEQLREQLDGPMPDEPTDPATVIDHLVAGASDEDVKRTLASFDAAVGYAGRR